MKPSYRQSKFGKRETKAILSAYKDLTYREREYMNKLTNPLIDKCRGLSREGALETVGKIGIVLANNIKKS